LENLHAEKSDLCDNSMFNWISGFKMYGTAVIIILDMIMPVMGGRDTFSHIQSIDKHAKVILSSGFSKEDDLIEMKKNGLCCFVRKPFHLAELSKSIADVLSQSV
jgi:DNA-binding NtrC family response regulator